MELRWFNEKLKTLLRKQPDATTSLVYVHTDNIILPPLSAKLLDDGSLELTQEVITVGELSKRLDKFILRKAAGGEVVLSKVAFWVGGRSPRPLLVMHYDKNLRYLNLFTSQVSGI